MRPDRCADHLLVRFALIDDNLHAQPDRRAALQKRGLDLIAVDLTGTAAAAVTLVGSYAGAFAAYYAATHGFGADTVAGLNMISKFSDLIAAGATGVCALAIGGAGLASRRLPRWAAWISIVVGAVDIVSGTGPAQLNLGTLVGFAWMIMLGVVLLRGPARVSLATADGRETESRMVAGLS